MSRIELEGGQFLVVKAAGTEAPPPMISKEGNISLVSSTEFEDSQGDIIYQGKSDKGAGWQVDRFNAKPVILWQHDIGEMNLSGPGTTAKVKELDGLGKVLVIDPLEFDSEDETAARLEGKVRRKSITESSVGFIGIKSELIDPEGPDWGGRFFYEQELIEDSLVNRGANFHTDAFVKSLLGRRTDIALRTEIHGDAEGIDIKDELYHLTEKVELLTAIIKSMGNRPDEAAEVEAKVAKVAADSQAVLVALVKRLDAQGTYQE